VGGDAVGGTLQRGREGSRQRGARHLLIRDESDALPQNVFTSSVEAGFDTFVTTPETAAKWRKLAAATFLAREDAPVGSDERIVEHDQGDCTDVGVCVPVTDGDALQQVLARCAAEGPGVSS